MTIKQKAREWVDGRIELSGEDEAPNISSLIDKELTVAFLAGAKAALNELKRLLENEFTLEHTTTPDQDMLALIDELLGEGKK